MKCEDALILISGHIDSMNTESEEKALQAHLSGCENCRRILKAYMDIDAGLLSDDHAPAALKSNVMKQLRKESTRKKRRPWMGIAVAAALVLTVGLGSALYRPVEQSVPVVASETASEPDARVRAMSDPSVVARQLASERDAAVAVVRELYPEVETYECELVDEYVLYILPDYDAVDFLGSTYGCEVYEPAGISHSAFYALLAP